MRSFSSTAWRQKERHAPAPALYFVLNEYEANKYLCSVLFEMVADAQNLQKSETKTNEMSHGNTDFRWRVQAGRLYGSLILYGLMGLKGLATHTRVRRRFVSLRILGSTESGDLEDFCMQKVGSEVPKVLESVEM